MQIWVLCLTNGQWFVYDLLKKIGTVFLKHFFVYLKLLTKSKEAVTMDP